MRMQFQLSPPPASGVPSTPGGQSGGSAQNGRKVFLVGVPYSKPTN